MHHRTDHATPSVYLLQLTTRSEQFDGDESVVQRTSPPRGRSSRAVYYPWCDSAPTPSSCACFHEAPYTFVEIAMYIGGGILGTILLILFVVWLVRRV
jgi:hypothetical protein